MANVKDLLVNGSARVIGTIYGNATSANKLNTNAGSSSQPVYFSNGVPVAITGTISNNAATATKATQDSAGQQINTTYIKGLSVSGRTITYTKGDGTTGTITTQDNNTTYSAGTGLSLSGTTFNHKNSVTAGTAQGDANKTLTFGGTFTIPTITYDAQGHITGKGTTTMTMPANPNTDTHWTTGITAGETGTTSNSATTNGNTFIKIKDNSTHRGQIKLVGSGATSVSSDANGVITISSTDNNTTYGSMSVSEGTTGTATSNRVLTAANLKGIINAHAPTKTGSGASGTWGISISGNAATSSSSGVTERLDSYDTRSATRTPQDTPRGITLNFKGNSTYGLSDGGSYIGLLSWRSYSTAGDLSGGYPIEIAYTQNGNLWTRLGSSNTEWGSWRKILDSSNYTNYTVTKTGSGASGTWGISISGNAATATKLATARTINGTSFDGSAAITTANWGAARTLTIGNTGKSVNGSGNVSWSLSEIGAAASSHNHTSLTGVTSIAFSAESSDSASIKTTIIGSSTCFDFMLADDLSQYDVWRWRFTPSDGTIYDAMKLEPTAQDKADLYVGGTKVSLEGHTHNYAGSTIAGGPANYVKTSLIIKLNGGTNEGNNLFTFNGSAAKTINITPAAIGASASGHTHSYAGSASAGGSANSAVKLDTATAGDSNTPVYFSGGKPVACTSLDLNTSGNAATATKVNNKLTIGSKTFDGSAAVTIAASDLGLASAMLFLGTTTTAITDGAKTNPVAIGGSNKTVTAGNVVLYGSKEFVWTGSAWEELGNEGSYKIVQVAVGDPSASGTSNTFIATISQDTNGKITATKKTVAVTNSAPTLSWGATSTIGTVAGTNLQVKMPANPNTWRGIQNNLTSDSTTDSLSAAQGKALKGLIDGKAASNHTHSYLPLSGGTLTGNITFAAPKTAGQKVGFTFDGVTDSASVYYLEPNLSDDGRIRLEISDNPDDAIEFAWRLWNPEDYTAYGSNPFIRHKFTFNGYNTGGTITSSSTITGGSLASNGALSVKGAGTFGGDVTASTFHGNLDGSATKATKDSADQQINTTYIKGLSVSGRTITYTKGDGTTGTITTQDTNTTYGNATTSAAGLMSKDDKAKLDGITASADAVSFTRSLTSGTKVGTITINGTGTDLYAPTNTDTHWTTGLKVGASNTATANAAASNGSVYLNVLDNSTVRDSHKITGSGATSVTSDANGVITISSTNTTYGVATTSANGLMSASDKSKLDRIAAGANNYSHPTSSGNKHIPAGGSSGQILRWSADGTAAWGADNNTWRGIQNNLTSDSTTDSLAAAQGKALKALIDGKAASSHTHNYAGSSSAGGAANSAVKLSTARTITLSGAVTGSASFDGSKNITINTSNSQQTLPYSSSTSQLFVTSKANQASYTLSNFVDNAVYNVYVNGFKIPNSEYTVSSSGIVTLTNPPELANQEVEIVANYTSYVTTDSSVYNSSYLNYYRQATAPSNTNALWLDTSATTSSSSFTPKLYDGGKWNAIGGVDIATLDARYVLKSGDTTLDARYIKKTGDTMSGTLKFNDSQQIFFQGKGNSDSVYCKMGFMSGVPVGAMHCINTGNHQTDGAFYITSNGYNAGNDSGGIAIDNEGVTIFGAGDPGSNFTGVFRVINEDNISAGPIFRVQKDGKAYATALYGAVWNDYAEFRQSDITEPGRVVIENGDGTLSLSTKRLQRGAEVISDTYGFAIGETDECKTPIAATGRVLAYTYEPVEEYKSKTGWPVCSGPNGTVSIMTEEEEEKYPSRIIGTISEVPDYEEWGTGKVKTNGRVWIRIK